MKKVLIPVVVFFVLVIGSIIFFVNASFQIVQYGKSTRFHISTLSDGATLTVDHNGVTTQVIGRNIQRVGWVLDISDKERVYRKPDFNEDDAIYFHFSDSAEYIIAQDPEDSDSVYILYEYKGKKLRFHLTGYRAWYWATEAVSPEGIYIENIVIE
ncbi:MAG: hypothetical protein JXN10_04105 [Clostridia bacterium]|nr:hypothetical protein [Clostridia bacterium]MBN2882686.1 hypothetical protein [Clostridia bacterium]